MKSTSSIRPWRLAALALALAVIVANPLINFFCQNHFVQGWYQSIAVGELWFVSPLEGLESILVAKAVYAPAFIGMIAPLTLAFLLGRVFCSWICPLTLLLEIVDWLRRRLGGKKRPSAHSEIVPRWTLWLVLPAELLISMVLGAPLFVIFSPPGLIGRELMMLVFFRALAMEGLLLLALIALELFSRRLFCRCLCPLGALLALTGGKRRLRVQLQADACVDCGRCAKTCPLGLRPQTDQAASIYCWNCGDCVDCCPSQALRFRWR
ncbi:MAG: 4Fe-4S binding protein [Desulfobulbaceae bacterium]|jgi:ferredoxin-type protein NapH|nr:4Fe-4S binding protein [Desulfobulbaceae bacterium]